MKCEEISSLLDLMLDGELTDEQQRALEAHGAECPECAAQIRATRQMKALLGEMPPEVDVPLPAQAAWRNAVRAEARRKRTKRLYTWAGAAAAAVVLLVGVSLGVNGRLAPRMDAGSANLTAMEQQTVEETAEDRAEYEAAGEADVRSVAQPAVKAAETAAAIASDSAVVDAPVIETDGALIGAAPAEPLQNNAAGLSIADFLVSEAAEDAEEEPAAESAVMAAPVHAIALKVESVDAACAAIADLISEYDGTLDEQRVDGGANLYISMPSENVAGFVSAIAHLNQTGEAPEAPEVSGEADSALLIELAE